MRSMPTRRPAARDGDVRDHRPAAPGRRRSPAPGPLLARLDRGLLERLEARVHLSVSRDVNGYTVVTPSADSKVVYVSADGSDGNPGTINAPVQTVAAARAMTRDGMPDQILLRRGDVFATQILNWNRSGRSAAEPFVLGSYTDPARPSVERPKIATGVTTGFTNLATSSEHPNVSYFNLLGVAFEATDRNYRQPTPGFTVDFKSEGSGGTYGMFLLGPLTGWLVEDCSFQYYRTNLSIQAVPAWGSPRDVTFRRNVVADAYAKAYDATGKYNTQEGIYANGVLGLNLVENVFDHNGFMEEGYGDFGSYATIYNHNAYLNTDNESVVVTGNIFARASSHGVQARAGGVIKDNLFVDNPIAMSYGYVNSPEKPGGVFGEVSGNVVYGAADIHGQARGWGIEVGNLRPIANGGGTVVKNNIFSSYGAAGQPAIQLSYGVNTYNPGTAVGINDLTVSNNIVYGWTRGVYINPGFALGNSGTRFAYNNVNFFNNEFQQVNATPIVEHGTSYSPAVEAWRGNRYDIIGTATGTTPYFRVKGTLMTLAQWQAAVEPTASVPRITYPDPGRSPGGFNALQGGAATTAAFVAEARRLAKNFFRPKYTAAAAADYIKAGFAGQRVDALAPVARVDATGISAGGGSTHTFTVTWADDNQVNLSSIGTGDVVVTGPGGYSQAASLVSSTANADGSTVAAVYRVTAPGGVWTAGANGQYTVSVQAGQVADKGGNTTPAGVLGTFAVNILGNAPTASLVATDVTAPRSPATLTVTYTADGGLNVATLGDDDLRLTGPNGFDATARFVSVAPATNGSPRVATYVLDPPAGGWASDANGTYEVAVRAGSVANTTGVAIGSAVLGTFKVNVSVPTARATADAVTDVETTEVLVTVTYAEAAGIDAATIDANDIRVQGPNYQAGAADGLTVVSVTGAGTPANPLVAVYRVPAPPGGFNGSNVGTATVVLNDDQVRSTGGFPANGGPIGSFVVAIDDAGPVGVAVTPSVYKPTGLSAVDVLVTYTDPSGVAAASLGTGDVEVQAPFGTVVPTYQSHVASGTSVTATYRLAVPGGVTAARNGTYYVHLLNAEVADRAGFVNYDSFIGDFRVAIDSQPPTPTPYVDPTIFNPPTDAVISVSYFDDPGVDVDTIDDLDVRVTGPNGFDQPATLGVVEYFDDFPPEARYVLRAPEGGWRPGQNGTYHVRLQPNQIGDLSGNLAPGQELTTFVVAVPTAVTAAFAPVSPNPAAAGLGQLTLRFNQPVTGFDLSDLDLTRNGGADLLTGSQTITSTDGGATYVIGGLAPLTGVGGNYTATLKASGSNIRGGGGQLNVGATLAFRIDAVAPAAAGQATNVTAPGAAPATITVTYTDDSAVNAATLTDGDLLVTGPAGYSQAAKLVSVSDASNGPVRTATYAAPAPAGGWGPANNGTYTVKVQAAQVADASGNFVPAQTLTTFTVAANPPADTTGPSYTGATTPVTVAGSAAATVTVTYTDATAVNATTIGNGDVIVTGPAGSGYSQVATLVSVDSTANGPTRTATYTVPAPAGGWQSAHNGTYGAYVRANQVADTVGNFAATGFVAALQVNVPAAGAIVNGGFEAPAVPGGSHLYRPVNASWSFSITGGIASNGSGFTAQNPAAPEGTQAAFIQFGAVASQVVTGMAAGQYTLSFRAAQRANSQASYQVLDVRIDGVSVGQFRPAGGAYEQVVTAPFTVAAGSHTVALAGLNPNGGDNTALVDDVRLTRAVDATPPTAAVAAVSPNPRSTPVDALTVSFSEPVTGFDLTDLTLARSGTAVTLGTGVTLASTDGGKTYTVGGLTALTAAAGSYAFAIKNTGTGIKDASNNPLTTGATAAWTTTAPALAIGATPAPVTGTTAALSALNGGTNTATKFAWLVTSKPAGAIAPTFSANNSNAAKATTLTFFKAGSYALKLTSTTGTTVKTATLTVTVNQTVTAVAVAPATTGVTQGQTQQFTATAKDQFGALLTTQPTFAWTVDAGGVGAVSAAGLYTAPAAAGGTAKVRATAGGKSAAAAVTVTAAFVPAKVNFQKSGSAPVTGYLIDTGSPYAARNGRTYGWSASHTDAAVDRGVNGNQLLDTNIGIKAGARWEIAVPTGSYSVKLSVGDASVVTTNTVRLEGTTVLSGVRLAANTYSAKTVTVTVTDGRLTLDAGSAANLATRVDYIEITKLG